MCVYSCDLNIFYCIYIYDKILVWYNVVVVEVVMFIKGLVLNLVKVDVVVKDVIG